MLRHKALFCLFVLGALATAARAAGVPTPVPSFTISASNVTMPPSGTVAIPFTLTSVNGFVGSVGVLCIEPTVAGSVHEGPYCANYGPARSYSLTANGTATGTYEVVAKKPPAVPVVGSLHLRRQPRGATWALASVLLLGLGFSRRSRRISRGLLVVAMAALAGIGMSGCGGPPTLTPGAYIFTLSATSVSSDTQPSITENTTATVTVPAGIVTDSTSN